MTGVGKRSSMYREAHEDQLSSALSPVTAEIPKYDMRGGCGGELRRALG